MTPEDPITITLTRFQWKIIMHLALRGGKESLEVFVNGTAHTAECISANVNAVKALHEQIYRDQALTDEPSPEGEAVH